jgi:glutamate-5-semialdehyde dehydrogenase
LQVSEALQLAAAARQAAPALALAGTEQKNAALAALAALLREQQDEIIAANAADLAAANDLTAAVRKRLELTPAKVEAMAVGVEAVAALADPVGETLLAWELPNGLQVKQVRVPLGVIGIIYESRPNVTVDAAALCLKAGNATVLRGGKEARESNVVLAGLVRRALAAVGLPEDAMQLLANPDRRLAQDLMRATGLVDVLIPRGGPGLIRAVLEEARVPVIETGAGVCHTFIERSADPTMAVAIAVNAKVSNPAVCNAMETLLVDRPLAAALLPELSAALRHHGVALRGCPEAQRLVPGLGTAGEDDWAAEYLDLTLAVRVVDGLDEALAHIARYSTKHSEAIVTGDDAAAQRFTAAVDAAAVYVNASTRFTDGFEFGFGAEIGISTQKLHARGPMGLRELTSYKYVVAGTGQVRG